MNLRHQVNCQADTGSDRGEVRDPAFRTTPAGPSGRVGQPREESVGRGPVSGPGRQQGRQYGPVTPNLPVEVRVRSEQLLGGRGAPLLL
jgi:hypothetical protein